MTEKAENSAGNNLFRPRARIMRTLGDELISSGTVAILELVKNSYDADATRVLVRFNEPLKVGKGGIEVIDNGHGMSLATIQTTWMEPATLVKKRRSLSEGKQRRVLGEKGIGRFAAAKLADYLEVITRRAESTSEVRTFFDWSQFDDESKYLDQVQVLWEETAPGEFCPGGVIEELWKVDGEDPEPADLTHGAILRMESLRVTWDRDLLEKTRNDLSRLVSPFFYAERLSQKDKFQIFLQLPTPFEDLTGLVEPPTAIRNPHYTIRGDIDGAGNYSLEIGLKGQEKPELISGQFFITEEIREPDGKIKTRRRKPVCGPFHVELRVWDRDQTSMAQLAREYNSTLQAVRRDLNDAAGISIYRDGFRVLPYGEPRNDWLRLDMRRVQNPTMRLSNNQIVGYVIISSDQNPELRDQSNREGLVEGPALSDLRHLVEMTLNELETRRYSQRPRQEKISTKGLFTGFDLKSLAGLVREKYPDDAELIALLGEKEQDLEQRVDKVQAILARYRRLATLGQLIDTVLHDGRTPVAKIRNATQSGLRAIRRARKVTDALTQKLNNRFETIDAQSDMLATVFNRIAPFGGRKRGRPKKVRIEQVIADAFSVLDTKIARLDPQVILPQTETWGTLDTVEIQEVLINLLDNSLYWLEQIPQDKRKIEVQVQRKNQNQVDILFSDSGPGVSPEFRERIFEPYFSTKPDGVGLGLAIAGEIVSDYYDGSLELLEDGPLPGATFRITLRRRVTDA